MSELLKERSEIDPEYTWDLSTLFASDADFEAALAAVDPEIAALAAYQGKLNNADAILAFLDERTLLERKISNLFVYAHLRHSEDTRSADAQSMFGRTYGKYATAVSATAFAVPEILSLDENVLNAIVADEKLAGYRFNLEDLLRQKAHTLSGKEEALLAGLQEALAAPRQAAEALMDADMRFDDVTDGEGKTHELTGSNYILLQSSNDRTLRENAFRSYYRSFKGHINTFAATYAGNVKAAVAEAKARRYTSSRQMDLAADNIPESVYDSLIESVHAHMDTMYRYVALRKKLLGVDELHYYDVYAPLVKDSEQRFTYEEAQKMVLSAVAPLGSVYTDVVEDAFKSRWIDVYPNKGKSTGAFSSGTYDSNPYIMTNFTGTLDSVSTIAHEMGHSMHTWRTKNSQPPQYADYSLFVAEVASTVNENLLIEQLLKDCDDPRQRLALLNQYLEGFKGTVFRQTMFAEFEKEAHAMAERGESLDPASLNSLYKKLIALYFGSDLVIDDEVQYEWARIPHFYRPFYVYVYATGYSSAVALSQAILEQGEPAVKRYLEFLSMGGSAYPLDELKHAGIDLTTPEPVDRALAKFAQVVEDAERTAGRL